MLVGMTATVVTVAIAATVAVLISMSRPNDTSLQEIQIPELEDGNVRMRNKDEVYRKITALVAGMKDTLQIITDFDKTISKPHQNGVRTPDSYAIFTLVPSLPKTFREAVISTYLKYHKYELDPHMSVVEKTPYIEKWWVENEKLLIGLPCNESDIDRTVEELNIPVRSGCDVAFQKLHSCQVPVLVFSAGLSTTVRSILRQRGLLYSNVHVVSNEFNVVNGTIKGYKNSILHAFNKNQRAILDSEYFKEASQRPNIILMGDYIGDANMDEGRQGDGVVLKIGFFSQQSEDYLPQYLDKFDIVLLEDQTMNVFNSLLDQILNLN